MGFHHISVAFDGTNGTVLAGDTGGYDVNGEWDLAG